MLKHAPIEPKKKLIPGTSGVHTSERLVHVSEFTEPPPNIQKAPLPKGNKNVSKTKQSVKNLNNVESNKVEVVTSSVAVKEESVRPRYEYFIAVRVNGLGKDDGWGVIGEEASKAIDSLVESASDILSKVVSLSVKKAEKMKDKK